MAAGYAWATATADAATRSRACNTRAETWGQEWWARHVATTRYHLSHSLFQKEEGERRGVEGEEEKQHEEAGEEERTREESYLVPST